MDYKRILLVILIMALVTYLPRVIPLAVFRKKIKNPYIQSFLVYMPYGVLAAMVFPDIFTSTACLVSAIAGTVVALILAWRKLGLLIVALGATGTVFLTEWILTVSGSGLI
ncbi:AzlD domain-containing protein [Candidatus Soleaferrea massiliensis]|uniref:AzlD domain-containing protein n=1 Tax=Candidatus Soleaferrea massiliensis TaxID=1470354 RepID=UPI00058F5990|nr:AzlD domain-containing protein [Candidatus Soleaferrea massiliensis]